MKQNKTAPRNPMEKLRANPEFQKAVEDANAKAKILSEEIAVTVASLLILHGAMSSGKTIDAEMVWDAARKFVEVGKVKLKIDVLAELAAAK